MLRLISALCVLILFLTACQSSNDQENDNDFPSSIDIDKMIQRQNPMMGQVPKQVSVPDMIAQMEVSVAEFPDDTATIYSLAKLNYQQYMADSSSQLLDKTISYYNRVLELDPSYEEGRPYYNRMLAKLNKGEYSAALEDLSTFVRINAGRIPLNHQATKAEILFQQGKLEIACTVYQEAKAVAIRDSLPTGNEDRWAERCPE